jgi:hypothetical protein
MKAKQLIVLGLAAIFILPACNLYEDGPLISLYSKEKRIANVWVAEAVTESDGTDITDDYEGWVWTLTEGGEATISYPVLGSTLNFNGTWNLIDEDEVLQLIIDYGVGNSISEFTILRLTENELWLRAEDDTEFQLEPK